MFLVRKKMFIFTAPFNLTSLYFNLNLIASNPKIQ